MQTFLPYPDYAESARVLDNRRLGKQRVECLQILNVLAKGEYICDQCKEPWHEYIPLKCKCKFSSPKRTPWYNHPAVQMWEGYETSLIAYGQAICAEWMHRGFKDTCWAKITGHVTSGQKEVKPDWISDALCASHRSNLLRKDPVWYSQFCWTESPDLPYVWPTKLLTEKERIASIAI
jgi:hypothetical protein